MSGRRGRSRRLTPEEERLWRQVAATVTPLPGRPPLAADLLDDPAPPALGTAAAFPPAAATTKPPPPLAPLEPRLARALGRGSRTVDARLDLHGLRQNEAHLRLNAFLAGAQAAGHRLVLVITGKGGDASDAPLFEARGVLRRLVPLWLEDPGLRPIVLGFSQAQPGHGGAGALYVRLRRRR